MKSERVMRLLKLLDNDEGNKRLRIMLEDDVLFDSKDEEDKKHALSFSIVINEGQGNHQCLGAMYGFDHINQMALLESTLYAFHGYVNDHIKQSLEEMNMAKEYSMLTTTAAFANTVHSTLAKALVAIGEQHNLDSDQLMKEILNAKMSMDSAMKMKNIIRPKTEVTKDDSSNVH